MLELHDLINLARNARDNAERAKREEAYWLAMVNERRGVVQEVETPLQSKRCVQLLNAG